MPTETEADRFDHVLHVSKHMLGYLVAAAMLLSSAYAVPAAYSQEPAHNVLREVEAAFAGGDVKTLVQHSADRVEIALFGASRLFSRQQARYVLQSFFDEHHPTAFKFRASTRTEKGLFAEGEYRYRGSDSPCRVYVRMRRYREHWELRQILIERRDR